MPNPSQVVIPTLTSDEVVQSASGLAAHAKARFLAGFADEAHSLAVRAAHMLRQVDEAGASALRQLAERFKAHAPPVIVPPPAAAPALRTDGPTPKEWLAAGYTMENYPPAGYAAKKDAPPPAT